MGAGTFYWRRTLLILLLLPMVAGCTKSAPTSPSFQLAGTWTGYWKDYYTANIRGVPNGSSLTLNVAEDGSAWASGRQETVYANGTLVDKIHMILTVYPDGSVTGRGEWYFAFPGIVSFDEEGEVIGQLDAEAGIGCGDLLIELDGILFHFPWRVERE